MNNLQIMQNSLFAPDTLNELYDRYIKYLDVKPCTLNTYKKGVRQFLNFLGARGITSPERSDIIAFKEEMKANHKPSTAQTYLASVKSFYNFLECEGLAKNIARHVKNVKLDNTFKKDYLTTSQAKELINSCDTNDLGALRDRAIISLMLTSGLRTCEVARANVEDYRTLGDSVVLYVHGKGRDSKDLFVKVSKETEKVIRAYLNARGEAFEGEPLFISLDHKNKGKRLATGSISRICKTHLRKIGLDSDRLTAHSFRHTAITTAMLYGENIQDVKSMARHASMNTTEIYNHALDMINNTCVDTVSKAIYNS